ncbi:DUF1080 domain-containing protein [Candidatus Sumerlaeota bacterium]|nr:DUF1080 domain-containing protein [Candidatus Sumerlaeota bacterium]
MKRVLAVLVFSVATAAMAASEAKPFVGSWALTIPGGGAGWLGVEEQDGALKGSVLWGGGSVLPVSSVKVDGDTLIVTRVLAPPPTKVAKGEKGEKAGKAAKAKAPARRTTETIKAKVEGDKMSLTIERDRGDGKVSIPEAFTGVRIPPLPARPDLSKVKFGDPINLFNGENLDGWTLMPPNAANGWSVKDGALANDPKQEKGQPHKRYGNLRTAREFGDFNLTLETNVPKGGNSGIYLRGIYEIQVADSFGRPLDSHNMGAIYSRICPTEGAEKPAGEWQTFDITLVDRHVTIVLNGKKITDNQPLLGCTGGALWSDQFRPGPIYLQGDHTGVSYRNIVLRPVVK